MPLSTYQELLSSYTKRSTDLQKKLRLLSGLRLSCFIGSIISAYLFFKFETSLFIFLAILLFVVFLGLIRYYDQQKRKLDISKKLAEINQTEISLLEGLPSPYNNGESYIDPHHPYSHDLDIFGDRSLFHYVNRTTTIFGNKSLSKSLLSADKSSIREKQIATKELVAQVDFRQLLQASGLIHQQEEKKIESLKPWLTKGPVFRNKLNYYLLLIFPVATICSIITFLITGSEVFKSIAGLLFVINLAISFSFVKSIMSLLSVSNDISKTLLQFSEQLRLIENAQWNSTLLKRFQSGLGTSTKKSSDVIQRLFALFDYLDIVFNIFVSPILNGLFLFHVRILFLLDEWKKQHGNHVVNYLEVIGEIESISSLANFNFNNPEFTIPEIADNEDLSAVELGHPLIRQEKRINNSISFLEKPFVILTGSNMSGKSTFLRTLGVNLVLAQAGAAVCARSFRFYPYEVFVSMRITDSLQDSESFFYAELKRLKAIIEHLDKGHKTFILLDEILRGTNSNDKHNGTIGLIKKLVAGKATGIIATHDLTVGALTKEYSGYLDNMCFESEIINNELVFDYRIKQGVCSRLSASFLMQKMGIITA